jgi:hypothetical protein
VQEWGDLSPTADFLRAATKGLEGGLKGAKPIAGSKSRMKRQRELELVGLGLDGLSSSLTKAHEVGSEYL